VKFPPPDPGVVYVSYPMCVVPDAWISVEGIQTSVDGVARTLPALTSAKQSSNGRDEKRIVISLMPARGEL
jgi:hypothetical protein